MICSVLKCVIPHFGTLYHILPFCAVMYKIIQLCNFMCDYVHFENFGTGALFNVCFVFPSEWHFEGAER